MRLLSLLLILATSSTTHAGNRGCNYYTSYSYPTYVRKSASVPKYTDYESTKRELLQLAKERQKYQLQSLRAQQQTLELVTLARELGLSAPSSYANSLGYTLPPAGAPVAVSRTTDTISGYHPHPAFPYQAMPSSQPSVLSPTAPRAGINQYARNAEALARAQGEDPRLNGLAVIQRRCVSCHAPGKQGADQLVLTDSAGQILEKLPRGDMAKAVLTGKMPPASAGELTPAEARAIAAWAVPPPGMEY